MLMLISPAKTLDYEHQPSTEKCSEPLFLKQAAALISELKTYSPQQISKLMSLSDKLAQLNVDRYQSWKRGKTLNVEKGSKQAIYAFKGDVYTGFDAESLSAKQMTYAQKRLRILSGLYGVLKPLDLIQPYRLEMGTKLKTDAGKDLYAFWGEQITEALNAELAALKSEVVVNLASNEYFKSVKARVLNAKVITPVFKDEKNGKYKIISFFAKKARGMMAAYAAQQGAQNPETLKEFDTAGYWFNEAESTEREWVFYREEQG